MQRVLEELKTVGKPDHPPKFEGRQIVVMMSPVSSKGHKEVGNAQDKD